MGTVWLYKDHDYREREEKGKGEKGRGGGSGGREIAGKRKRRSLCSAGVTTVTSEAK